MKNRYKEFCKLMSEWIESNVFGVYEISATNLKKIFPTVASMWWLARHIDSYWFRHKCCFYNKDRHYVFYKDDLKKKHQCSKYTKYILWLIFYWLALFLTIYILIKSYK